MSKYSPFAQHLAIQKLPNFVMDFAEVERFLSAPLPPSAYRHRAWWSNETQGSHVHCRAWLDPGYAVDRVDFGRRRVTFRKLD